MVYSQYYLAVPHTQSVYGDFSPPEDLDQSLNSQTPSLRAQTRLFISTAIQDTDVVASPAFGFRRHPSCARFETRGHPRQPDHTMCDRHIHQPQSLAPLIRTHVCPLQGYLSVIGACCLVSLRKRAVRVGSNVLNVTSAA